MKQCQSAMGRLLAVIALITSAATILCDGRESSSDPLDTERFGHQRGDATHVFKEYVPRLNNRNDLLKLGRVKRDYVHQIVFVVQQKNIDLLTNILHDVSDPESVNYGNHITRDQVTAMTSNPESRDTILSYLESVGANVVAESLSGEYITANASIKVWENVFNTEFYYFHKTHQVGHVEILVRSENYSIPIGLVSHVESAFNTIQIPHISFGSGIRTLDGNISSRAYSFPGFTTLSRLRVAYNMGSSTGSAASTQAVFAAAQQYFSPDDLNYFQRHFGVPDQPVATTIGEHSSNTKCKESASNCDEGNLDVQYLMATSPSSPTTFWYTDFSFGSWLLTVANTTDPPLVFSISYGIEEAYLSNSEMSAFTTQAIKLSAVGVTLVASSGDDGAVPRSVRLDGVKSCTYGPLFPASNPYVTAVGGTMVSETQSHCINVLF